MARIWTEVNKAEEKKYIEHGGAECPWCQSSNVEGSRFDPEMLGQEIHCQDCEAVWLECYEITTFMVEQGSSLSKDFKRG